MARGKLKSGRDNPASGQQGTLVLDCDGLSRLVDDSVAVVAIVVSVVALFGFVLVIIEGAGS